MATQTEAPLPLQTLYALLKALDPAKIAKGRAKADPGTRTDPAAKRAFDDLVAAAGNSRTASQFTKSLTAQVRNESTESHGAITTLTVEYTKNGYTIIKVRFEDGTNYLTIYPTT